MSPALGKWRQEGQECSKLPSVTAMVSFNCQLDRIYNHLGRLSQSAIVSIRLACRHIWWWSWLSPLTSLGRSSLKGYRTTPWCAVQKKNCFKKESRQIIQTHIFISLRSWLLYDKLLQVSATWLSPQWWTLIGNCEQKQEHCNLGDSLGYRTLCLKEKKERKKNRSVY